MIKIQRLFSIIRVFKNWPEIILAKFSKTTPQLILRNGVTFTIENLNSNLMTVLEIWNEKQYGEGFVGVVVDLGANIGAFSVYAAKAGAKVYAYEPEKKNYELLRKNTEGMNVEVFERGVAGTEGERTLHVAGVSSGKNSLSSDFGGVGKSVAIQCVTLEQILNDIKCDVLKMDVEGAEYEILFATPKNMLPKMIVMEWHHSDGKDKNDIIAYLQNDFNITEIGDSIIRAVRR